MKDKNVDWAMLRKTYSSDPSDGRRYSPPVYNFARPQMSLKNPSPDPAMAASVADHVWTLQEIAALSIETDPLPPPA